MPRLSVVVPVRNESAHLAQTLAGLFAQDLPAEDYEILVVDGASEDHTIDIVREFQQQHPNLFVLHNPQRLASAARNIGVRHAHGDYILIVDGHCVIRDPQHFSKVLEAFHESGADCLGRPQPLRSPEPTAKQRAVAAARMSWLGHNPHSAIFSDAARFVPADNVAVAYRRGVFERVGGFDESFDACEDVDFNTRIRRAGLTCYFTPAIVVEYQPRASLRGLAYQMARYGRGRARLAWKFPTSITLPSLVPPLWMLWLLAGAVAACLNQTFALLYVGSVCGYLAVVLLESLRVGRAAHVVSWQIPLVFMAIHAGYGWGYWKELVLGAPLARSATTFFPQALPTPRR